MNCQPSLASALSRNFGFRCEIAGLHVSQETVLDGSREKRGNAYRDLKVKESNGPTSDSREFHLLVRRVSGCVGTADRGHPLLARLALIYVSAESGPVANLTQVIAAGNGESDIRASRTIHVPPSYLPHR